MVQLSALFNTLSKNIRSAPGKKSRVGVGREAAVHLAKEAKRHELVLTASGVAKARHQKNFAAAYSKQGKKGLNQDRFIVWQEFGCQEDMVFCGVFDGHGPWGHLVARSIRELMPSLLLCNWQEAVALNGHDPDYSLGLDRNKVQFDMWKQSYYKTCAAVDQELQRHPGIDSYYSGSTALALVRQGDLMIVANIGDSRAVLATTSDNRRLVATQLTVDHKPNLPHESKRIAQSRGRVYACPDEPGVHRVWMPNGQTVKGPGLAVSRAFGDYYIKEFGVISEPEITQRSITIRDQFAILATDGVWDVISNQEAVEIVGSTAERAESAKRLVEHAVCAWKQQGKSVVMDDISAVCLFFHHSTDSEAVDDVKVKPNKTIYV
ncbi:putative protein phosphatase 2C 73 [Sesamum alatum]|uniref:PPM-type phosphatase domain-containing protein n=1 Tax=Sesamum alatum TaxID=300844 RepID=A0AAE1Y9P0_9LAMI|nr:putative protein phosphatase 2C 73 [Sesamum alatum]